MLGYRGDDVVEDIPNSVQITDLWNYALQYMPEGQDSRVKILDIKWTPRVCFEWVGNCANKWKVREKLIPSMWSRYVVLCAATTFQSHLQKSSSLKEL